MTLAPVSNDLPAVFTPPTRRDTDSWVNVVADVVRLAGQIADTEFVPRGIRNSVPATAAAMLYGREVGLPPMTALSSIHVVDGRPGMSAEAMRALVLAAGHDIAFDEMSGALCKIRGRRSGSDRWTELTWSLDMARAAGLLGKDNWRKYPRDMLIARATGALCRLMFPDVIHGFGTVEELGDLDPTGGGGTHPPAPSAGKTTVGRKGARKTSAGVDSPVPAPADPQLPPLPGEETAEVGGDVGQTTTPPAEADTAADRPPVAPPPNQVETPTLPPRGDEGEVEEDTPDRRAGRPQLRMAFAQFRRLGLDDDNAADREERLALTSAIVGREVASFNDLTRDEAQHVIVTVSGVRDQDALRVLLARIDAGDNDDTPLPDPPPESE